MVHDIDLIELATRIVNEANHSFLSLEDITTNFLEKGFLVNPNRMIGYTSYMEYDKEKNRGIISYTIETSSKKQQEILLFNYAAYELNCNENFKMYYKGIPNKSKTKRLCRCIVDASVNKEFPMVLENNVSYENVQEGGKRK